MANLNIEAAPEDVGMSSTRLARLTSHVHSYVDDGRFAGTSTLIARDGKVIYLDRYGHQDREAGKAIEQDTIFRIFSMTKPIVSIALMQLYEQGLVQLRDPIERYIPAFADMRVFDGGSIDRPRLRPAASPITVHNVLTHMSGLTYGHQQASPVDGLYRRSPLEGVGKRTMLTSEVMEHLADLPLLCDPGTAWNYSMSTDVVGHLVEVISGQPLDEYLSEHVFEPIGMPDTGFSVGDGQGERLAALYMKDPDSDVAKLLDAPGTSPYLTHPKFFSGGGGLVSTMSDYHRFAAALLRGGELDGARIIGRKTLAFMTSNHLPDGGDLVSHGTPLFSETPYEGVGFGLGFSVQLDPAVTQVISSPGEFGWGGIASTVFFCDPVEDLLVIFLTQLLPSSTYTIRPELKALVYQALVD
jgi:CubicO group peptidase (beta-lactamase class C family)